MNEVIIKQIMLIVMAYYLGFKTRRIQELCRSVYWKTKQWDKDQE